jgi:hypothetical protein
MRRLIYITKREPYVWGANILSRQQPLQFQPLLVGLLVGFGSGRRLRLSGCWLGSTLRHSRCWGSLRRKQLILQLYLDSFGLRALHLGDGQAQHAILDCGLDAYSEQGA